MAPFHEHWLENDVMLNPFMLARGRPLRRHPPASVHPTHTVCGLRTAAWALRAVWIGSFTSLAISGAISQPDSNTVGPPPSALVSEWKLSPFYKKHLDAAGLPILSSEKVSDYALHEARFLIDQMLKGRDDVRAAMVKNRVRFVVLGHDEMTTAIPEYSDLTPAKYWDRRARGLGATRARPAVSCGEENLLGYPGDPYKGENILVHEFAHAIHEMGLRTVDPNFDSNLKRLLERAKEKGLWKGTYAETNPNEYWAEAVQSWFDCNQKKGGVHNDVDRRDKLQAYDPEVADLIASIFPKKSWRYELPSRRAEAPHLKGYDPAKAPRFSWPADLPPLKP